jgi:hypothetical protein
MAQHRSLKEIRELFKDIVEPEFIMFPPNDCWVVIQRKINVESGEFTTESSLKMNLHSIMRPIVEAGNYFHYISRLYECCVTAGQGSSNDLDSCYLSKEHASDSCWIQYEGPFILGKDRNKILTSSPTAQSLALESISIITQIARNNDRDKLNEIKNYLVYFQD